MVKVEGMGQEEAAVVAVAVRGGAGNNLPNFPLKGTLSHIAFVSLACRMGFSHQD